MLTTLNGAKFVIGAAVNVVVKHRKKSVNGAKWEKKFREWLNNQREINR